jgi:hypothetical protein
MDDDKDSVLEGSEHAPRDARLHGIVSQVKADHMLRPEESMRVMLAQRIRDAHIDLTDDQLDEIVQEAETDLSSGESNPNP